MIPNEPPITPELVASHGLKPDEYQRILENARKDIDAERDRALQSARDQVAGLVVAATQKVIGETLDDGRHRRLIERAIEEVAGGDSGRGRSGS